MSLGNFIDNMTAYDMLASLPPSYGMLASTLLSTTTLTSITSDQVLLAARPEYQCRNMQEEEVNGQGFLARKIKKKTPPKGQNQQHRRLGKDGKPLLVRDETKWCEEHKRYGHNLSGCYQQMEQMIVGKQSDGGRPPSGKVAMTAGEEKEINEDAYIALASTIASGNPHKITINSAASDHFICDKTLLHNLSPLARPLNIKVGNGQTITSTESGTLYIGKVAFSNAYYVPFNDPQSSGG
ncbi:hypothetical protein M231_02364 [Tremella mesenterica]|uniref:Uncharacterized protein n=1 Tax=Tremella mesenterica TaxID=5217 RepID=A0A4Q1BQZ8_TREME|nr:hypothetical protein M231_02364 [Tremella mesenterica]